MLRLIIAVSLGLLLNACGTNVYEVGTFGSYVDEFTTQAAQNGQPVTIKNLIVAFQPIADPTLEGLCTLTTRLEFNGAFVVKSIPTVYIEPNQWDAGDEYYREILMMHELGHCVLGLGHDASYMADNSTPRSIMFPYAIDSYTYKANQTYYLHELFNPPTSDNTLTNVELQKGIE